MLSGKQSTGAGERVITETTAWLTSNQERPCSEVGLNAFRETDNWCRRGCYNYCLADKITRRDPVQRLE